MPAARAQSSTAVHRAPDCEMKASFPGAALVCAKLALRPISGTSRPRQLGPRMRSRCGRAASSICCWRDAAPLSRPAVRTIAAFAPRWPSSAIKGGTVAGGVQMTARSGATGRLATSGYASTPATAWYFGFTGITGPANPPNSRLRITVAPTLLGRVEAPMTAMEPGRRRKSRCRMLTADLSSPRQYTAHAARDEPWRSVAPPPASLRPAAAEKWHPWNGKRVCVDKPLFGRSKSPS